MPTPIEETLEALNDVVKAGKARYIGASSMWAWQFMKALGLQRAQRLGAASSRCRTTTTCSTARRSAKCCRSAGGGDRRHSLVAAGARSAGAAWEDEPAPSAARTDAFGKTLYERTEEADRAVIEACRRSHPRAAFRRRRSRSPGMLQKPGITSPIVGATKPQHLTDAVAAVSVKLSDEEIKALEAPYVPHPVAGFS